MVVSALVDEDVDLSFKAMEAGALAVLRKPPMQRDPDYGPLHREFITTLKAMAGVTVVRRWQNTAAPDAPTRLRPITARLPAVDGSTPANGEHTDKPELVAIGASAGGPSALSSLLAGLPENFPLPIVIVQHMPDEFLPGLARWLGKHTRLKVHMAESGQALEKGSVYLAPSRPYTER